MGKYYHEDLRKRMVEAYQQEQPPIPIISKCGIGMDDERLNQRQYTWADNALRFMLCSIVISLSGCTSVRIFPICWSVTFS